MPRLGGPDWRWSISRSVSGTPRAPCSSRWRRRVSPPFRATVDGCSAWSISARSAPRSVMPSGQPSCTTPMLPYAGRNASVRATRLLRFGGPLSRTALHRHVALVRGGAPLRGGAGDECADRRLRTARAYPARLCRHADRARRFRRSAAGGCTVAGQPGQRAPVWACARLEARAAALLAQPSARRRRPAQRRRPDVARVRGAASARHRPQQRRHRHGAGDQPQHRGDACAQHPRQDRLRQPHRGGGLRDAARSARG